MKKRHKKLAFIIVGVIGIAVAAGLILNAFRKNLVFYYTPTQVMAGQAPAGHIFRIGGFVAKGSFKHHGLTSRFVLTDLRHSVIVHYRGQLPDLFREGQGVVVQGRLAGHSFTADQVLAKHDAKYMPHSVAQELKQAKELAQTKAGS